MWDVTTLLLLLVLGASGGVTFYHIRRLKKELAQQRSLSAGLLESKEKQWNRISGELHDSVGQNLLIIKNRAELGLGADGNKVLIKEQLKQISEVSSTVIEDTRRLARNLAPRHLTQLGLTEALMAMIDRLAASTKIRFLRDLEPVDDLLSVEQSVKLYRIAQEALNNVIQHAHCSCVKVQLVRDVRHVRLVVQDDGCGFDADAANSPEAKRGLGLAETAERVRILGGKLDLASRPDAGTRLSVTIGIDEAAIPQTGGGTDRTMLSVERRSISDRPSRDTNPAISKTPP